MIVPQPPPKPDPNTYWVVPGKVLAGEYPGARDSEEARRRLRRFLAAGLRHFIDLTETRRAHSLRRTTTRGMERG